MGYCCPQNHCRSCNCIGNKEKKIEQPIFTTFQAGSNCNQGKVGNRVDIEKPQCSQKKRLTIS